MSNDTQPEIRFPGFTEDWEQRKLGEVIDNQYNGQTPSRANASFWNGEINWLSSGELNRGVVSETIEKITEDGRKNANLKIVPKGTFVMAITGLEATGTRGNCAKLGIDTTMNQSCMALFPKKKLLDSSFLFQWYRKVGEEYGLQYTQGTKQQSYNAELLKILPIVLPSVSEQVLIADFFDKIDDTIALHQRKLDLLKETKKGFLQKMFPKNGAKVPEIRFPGFTEDWEERRLQEVVDRYDNLRIPITASKRVAGNTPYYGANGIQGYVEGYTHDGEFILVAEDGANDLKNYPVQYVDGKVWVNNHAHVIQAKENLADNMFLMNAIRSINIEPFLVGGGRAKLNADVLMKLEVIIPLKSEQQKIGNFFKQLDDTITLHQRKLDLLKEMKKGFLQKMFV